MVNLESSGGNTRDFLGDLAFRQIIPSASWRDDSVFSYRCSTHMLDLIDAEDRKRS